MNTDNGLKSYRLSPEEVESLLQETYGRKIEPVNQQKLQQLRRHHQQQAAMENAFKSRHTALTSIESE
jgi:hypothetical protein